MEKCVNCGTQNGMANKSARGFWDHYGSYLGGLCPNCVFYPERVSAKVRSMLSIGVIK